MDEEEYLTVQQLSASVEGKAQKYTCIGPLTMVPFKNKEKTMQNVTQACKDHFGLGDEYQCDMLAGERGPSYKSISQIKNWKLLHVRFIESDGHEMTADQTQQNNQGGKSGLYKEGKSIGKSSTIPKSVPLSQLIMMGKLIPPKKNVVTLQLEQFNITSKCWENPIPAILSISVEKFASGGSRDGFVANGMKGVSGKMVLKHYRPGCDCVDLEYRETFMYTKLYYGKLNDEAATIEQFIEGTFIKYINNTGEILVNDNSSIALEAESFAHYSYVKSGEQLIVVDIQGVGFCLFDPEIASVKLYDEDRCYRNLSRAT